MIISLVQYNPEWEAKSANMEKLISIINKKTHLGGLLIFPEMTLTGFTMNASEMSENKDGLSAKFFSRLASTHNIHVFAGIIEKSKNKNFNSLVHIAKDGKIKQSYRKIHPFSYSKEDKFYSKGKKLSITEVDGWKIGLSICYDLRFPELYRLYAKEGVKLIINIAN